MYLCSVEFLLSDFPSVHCAPPWPPCPSPRPHRCPDTGAPPASTVSTPPHHLCSHNLCLPPHTTLWTLSYKIPLTMKNVPRHGAFYALSCCASLFVSSTKTCLVRKVGLAQGCPVLDIRHLVTLQQVSYQPSSPFLLMKLGEHIEGKLPHSLCV